MTLKLRFSKIIINIYPPYRGAGIRIRFKDNGKRIISSIKLKWYNRNYVGTHFGGSLYSMCDPHFMWLLIENLGSDYIIWDRSAKIQFKKPARGTITAEFYIPEEEYQEIRQKADRGNTVYPLFTVPITDRDGEIVAIVEKELYVKRKAKKLKVTPAT